MLFVIIPFGMLVAELLSLAWYVLSKRIPIRKSTGN